jgi:threonylcarbamoyladenosine tRNA methylthiotransferase CDKAL1
MAKVCIKTQGCSHNYSDSEHMAGLLQQAGHELVEESDADLILFNTCTVKTPTEKQFLRDLKQVQTTKKKIVIGGCIPQADQTNSRNFH